MSDASLVAAMSDFKEIKQIPEPGAVANQKCACQERKRRRMREEWLHWQNFVLS